MRSARKHRVLFATLSAGILVIAGAAIACGGDKNESVADATPQAPSASSTSAAASLKITNNPTLGNILTDSAGRTLYTFANDVPNSGKSATTGPIAANWPAFTLTSGSPVKPDGLSGDLALITRDDGMNQITYKGAPLYYFISDAASGDVKGQGVATSGLRQSRS